MIGAPDYTDENIFVDTKVFVPEEHLRQLGLYMKICKCEDGRILDHNGNVLAIARRRTSEFMPWVGKEEPPCDCQKCVRRHGECAEFTASNNPNRTYNREYCHWFKEEEVET